MSASTSAAPAGHQKIKDICTAVKAGVEMPAEVAERWPQFVFLYQAWIAELSGALPSDTEEMANSKISRYLNENFDHLKCDHHNFNVPHGSLYKLAISANSPNFLDDLLDVWKPNFNIIDKADGRTLLDYIRDEMTKAAGTTREQALLKYYRRFYRAGARHGAP